MLETINCYNSGNNCSKLDNSQSTEQIDIYISGGSTTTNQFILPDLQEEKN